MSFLSITGVTLFIALAIVFAGSVVAYMARLVRHAYELKMELRGSLDDGLKQVNEEFDKRARAIRRDLIEEATKLREAVDTDAKRRIEEIGEGMRRDLVALQNAVVADRAVAGKAVETLSSRILDIEVVVRSLARERKRNADANRQQAEAPSLEPTAEAAQMAEEARIAEADRLARMERMLQAARPDPAEGSPAR